MLWSVRLSTPLAAPVPTEATVLMSLNVPGIGTSQVAPSNPFSSMANPDYKVRIIGADSNANLLKRYFTIMISVLAEYDGRYQSCI